MKTLVLLLSVFLAPEYHDFQFGRFELRPEEESITLFVRLDRQNILEAIRPTCADYNEMGKCFENYLNSHFALAFDGEEVEPKHNKHEFKGEFVELYFDLDISPKGITKIEVYNDSLIELYERQENILYSMLNDKRRSFRMNKERIRTIITY